MTCATTAAMGAAALAGSMYWNDTVWTDGVKWDKDKDAEAKKICEANGTACT